MEDVERLLRVVARSFYGVEAAIVVETLLKYGRQVEGFLSCASDGFAGLKKMIWLLH